MRDDVISWAVQDRPMGPGEAVVHLWRAELDVPAKLLSRYRELLSAPEQVRADRFRFDVHRNRYIVSRAMLRALLAGYLEVPAAELVLATGPHGKPELADRTPGLDFNLSHAAGLAVYAFSSGRRVGVDIEEKSRDVGFRELAHRFFSEAETRALGAVPDSRVRDAFYECWTRKEAYIKALGLGVTHGLNNFTVAFGPSVEPAVLHSDVDARASERWSMYAFEPRDGFAGALVVEGKGCRIVRMEPPPGAFWAR